jgi:hypothetical protein
VTERQGQDLHADKLCTSAAEVSVAQCAPGKRSDSSLGPVILSRDNGDWVRRLSTIAIPPLGSEVGGMRYSRAAFDDTHRNSTRGRHDRSARLGDGARVRTACCSATVK